jgi:hypothetical protein
MVAALPTGVRPAPSAPGIGSARPRLSCAITGGTGISARIPGKLRIRRRRSLVVRC